MNDDKSDDCSTCPRCRLRDRLTTAFLADDGEARHELLEQLLDAVEAVRAMDHDDEFDLVEAAVEQALFTVDAIQRIAIGGDDLEDE
jgi:hypothetical protein